MESHLSQENNFINPETIISKIDLAPESQVADFGCGSGYFVFPLARKLKEDGRVYALDILKDKLEAIESQAKLLGLTNIITKRVNLEKENGSGLEAESLDWVIIKDMLFQNKGKSEILAEARRVLKMGGKILLIEWSNHDLMIGPEKSLRISREGLMEIIQSNFLAVVEEFRAGDFHYGFVLSK